MTSTQAPPVIRRSPALDRLDRRTIALMREHGPAIARITLGIVFVWFGALKLAGRSPVEDLVATTMPWVAPHILIPALGLYEVVVGAMLLAGVFLRTALALLWLQMLGTFSVLVLLPHVAFQGGNPLLLTVEGEFVVKNLVLIAAGIVVGGSLRRRKSEA